MKPWTLRLWESKTAASGSIIAPNMGDHLDCEECGHVYRHLPCGALTSVVPTATKREPWEMTHTRHRLRALRRRLQDDTGCAPLGNRNGDCPRRQSRQECPNGDFPVASRAATPSIFANHTDRLTQPLLRRTQAGSGYLGRSSDLRRPENLRDRDDTAARRLVSSVRTVRPTKRTLLQKVARVALGTNNIDTSAPRLPAFAAALAASLE